MKQAGHVLGKEGLGALWLKEHGAAEESMAQQLKGYFVDLEQQVFEAVDDQIEAELDAMAEDEEIDEAKIGQEAEELADELIDVDEVYGEILDVVRDQIYNQVATGAMTEWRLNVPGKQLDLSWIKSPLCLCKDVCREPAGSPGGGQFASCDGGTDSGAAADPSTPRQTAASSLRADFSKLPTTRAGLLDAAKQAGDALSKVSVSAEADAAVDRLADKDFKAIRDRYGDLMGNAIIGAGFLGSIAGMAGIVGAGGLIAAGAVSAHSYVGAASAIVGSLAGASYASHVGARYAIAPLVGAARYIRDNFGAAVGTKEDSDDLAEVKAAAEKEWATYLDHWDSEIEKADWAKAVKEPVDVGGMASGLRIDLPPVMRDAVENFAEDILSRPYWRDVAETIRDDIAQEIRNGVLNGLSGKQIAKNLKDAVDSESRANNIARTETTGALNAGHQATREELAAEGLIDGKEWLSILDQSVRDTHEEANGQKKPVDEPFEVGGEEGMYPGDPDFSASERCNCRCTSVSTFSPDDEIAGDDEEKWAAALKKWFMPKAVAA